MIHFIESTWPIWWAMAILALLRWFHLNALAAQADEERAEIRMRPATGNPTPHAI